MSFPENSLAREKSPYLLQHKNNPVDWHPWNDSAFSLAREKNKPIFLSIGYATCHWCHVMEKESFEDPQVAALMNEHFVCIKVDREERPDIDAVYMNVCQLLYGHGGWPLTIVMSPDKEPFFAATYIPKKSRHQQSGMLELLPALASYFHNQKEDVQKTITEVLRELRKNNEANHLTEEGFLTPDSIDVILRKAATYFSLRFDQQYGGFGSRPKFPSSHNLVFLMNEGLRQNNQSLIQMAFFTLNNIRLGGVYDQIGFGFHRYSTDAYWFAPHFEKMLYDQAMMIITYCLAFQISKNPFYRQVVFETVSYLKSSLTSAEGGFVCAEDADSEGEEGLFYMWDYKQLEQVLNQGEREVLQQIFEINEHGNFFDEASGHNTGLNHFMALENFSRTEVHEFYNRINSSDFQALRKKIYELRETRIHPIKDDKVICDWNALMLAALAISNRVLADAEIDRMIFNNISFIEKKFFDDKGELYHRYRDQETAIAAFNDDYAFLIMAYLELFQTYGDTRYFVEARQLQARQIKLFSDMKNGGFFMSTANKDLPFRHKEFYDGAYPCGNSISLKNLLMFYHLTAEENYLQQAELLLSANRQALEERPAGFTMQLQALQLLLTGSRQLVIVAKDKKTCREGAARVLCDANPGLFIILKYQENSTTLAELFPFTAAMAIEETSVLYLCQGQHCDLPLRDFEQLKKKLNS